MLNQKLESPKMPTTLDDFIKSCTKKFWESRYEPLGFEIFHRYCDSGYPRVKFYVRFIDGVSNKYQAMELFRAVMVEDCLLPNTSNVVIATLEWIDSTKYKDFLTPWSNLYLDKSLTKV